MNPKQVLLVMATSLTVARPVAADCGPANYWCDSWRGWHFYEEQQLPEQPAATPAPPRPTPAKPADEPYDARSRAALREFAALKKRLEDYRSIAIVTREDRDIRRYMELEAQIVGDASDFADRARRLAWGDPKLDTLQQGRPTNARALEVYEREQLASRDSLLASLASTHAVFFFFRSDCPYCHAMAPTVLELQAKYGLQIVPVSLDGGTLPGLPPARMDNGIASTLRVTQVPATFLANPGAASIAPLGLGVMSLTELVERIAVASQAARPAGDIASSLTPSSQ